MTIQSKPVRYERTPSSTASDNTITILETFDLSDESLSLREDVKIVYIPLGSMRSITLYSKDAETPLTFPQVMRIARNVYNGRNIVFVRTEDGEDKRLIVDDSLIEHLDNF